jgi:hypothetical protein
MMRRRERAEPEPAQLRRREAEPEPPAHELLELQRRLGNQAVQRLLARKERPTPTRTPIPPVANLYGGTSAEQWEKQLDAGGGVKELYAEIASLLNATVIEDVAGTKPENINGALRVAADELKPGLNFVTRMQTPGKCGYLYDNTFTGQLPVRRDGPLPSVAILLGPAAFVAGNKSRTLAVLRHELAALVDPLA